MDKKFVYLAIGIGGLVGSYLPVLLFKIDGFGFVSILCGVIGSLTGLFIAYKIIQNY